MQVYSYQLHSGEYQQSGTRNESRIVLPPRINPNPLIPKYLDPDEKIFLEKCLTTMEELTGELWDRETPEWLSASNGYGNFKLELDGYSSRLKMAIELESANIYQLPMHMMEIYNPFVYFQFVEQIKLVKNMVCQMLGINIITIPNYMEDSELKKYLTGQLHNLTTRRMWVGMPKPKTPGWP